MEILCSGFGLVESPRWHEGRLWFSDWTGGRIVAVDDAGVTEVVVEHESLPLCFDFLPDGRLVLVSNQERALLPSRTTAPSRRTPTCRRSRRTAATTSWSTAAATPS